jgi:hypothetical protein
VAPCHGRAVLSGKAIIAIGFVVIRRALSCRRQPGTEQKEPAA